MDRCCQSNCTGRPEGEFLPRLPVHRQANGVGSGDEPNGFAALRAICGYRSRLNKRLFRAQSRPGASGLTAPRGAFAALEEAVVGATADLYFLKREPFLDPIRGALQFAEMLKHLNFP